MRVIAIGEPMDDDGLLVIHKCEFVYEWHTWYNVDRKFAVLGIMPLCPAVFPV
jgi:hypothetical protein